MELNKFRNETKSQFSVETDMDLTDQVIDGQHTTN